MPTAIVRWLTSSGFVITADGKIQNAVNRETLNTTTQKIFPIPGAPAAYALYGTVGLGNEKDDDSPGLHLGDEIGKIVASGMAPSADLLTYSQQLAETVHDRIQEAKDNGLIEYPSIPSEMGIVTIANVFIFGFTDGAPSEVRITFWHRQHVLGNPRVVPFNPRANPNPYAWGSDSVWNLLKVGDHRFARFGSVRIPANPEAASLLEAAKFGENYILACDSYEGRSTDPYMCESIGGHIHIAAITPTCFHWLKPPSRLPEL
jgi:hypothetical protein